MTLSRKDFVRLTVVAVGSASLASILPGCGGSSSETDGGMGGGSGGGTGGGSGGGTGGGSGGGSGGGTGGGSGGGSGGGTGGGSGGGTGGGGDMDAGAGGGGGDLDAGTGGGGGSMSTCDTNGAHDSAISANHGHALMVPAADFMATGDKTYDITGTATHAHSITLTAAQRSTIASGGMVTVQSTVGGAHTHMVTVACA